MLRLLPQNLINQIAAGEVVERPASAIKELVENAIDAKSRHIDIKIVDGGKTYFSVQDDGKGMTKDELSLAIERHATSKLPNSDLFNINFLGFRGEALPSIGSVSKLSITSRPVGASEAWKISVEAGVKTQPAPAPLSKGTLVEVADLFFATPARLKFLKATQTEISYIKSIVNNIAMAYPDIHFTLATESRQLLNYPIVPSLFKRVVQVIGKGFDENALSIDEEHHDISVVGFVGLPTYTRSTNGEQYLFVNGRFVKDKVLIGAIRGAYQGLISHDVHPVVALFISLPNEQVDVNVHPAKTQVRFQNAAVVRGVLITAIRAVLSQEGHKTSSQIAVGMLEKSVAPILPQMASKKSYVSPFTPIEPLYPVQKEVEVPLFLNDSGSFGVKTERMDYIEPIPTMQADSTPIPDDFPPMGFAKAQLHKTYIISQTKDSIIITDQHAAHERLTYEKMIQNADNLQGQVLLIPEIVDMDEDEVALLLHRADELKSIGLIIDAFGLDSIVIREIPAIFKKTDFKQFMRDLVDTIKTFDDTVLLKDKITAIYARMACHGSIRAGRVLSLDEMNALLRQMENCGTSGQCIHGRPTYIELKLSDVERLFARTK